MAGTNQVPDLNPQEIMLGVMAVIGVSFFCVSPRKTVDLEFCAL